MLNRTELYYQWSKLTIDSCADQSVEVADGCECSDGQQPVSDSDGGVDSTASADAGDQLGHEVRLHDLRIAYISSCSSSSVALTMTS